MASYYSFIRRILNRTAHFDLSAKRVLREIFKYLSDGLDFIIGISGKTLRQNQLLEGTVTWIEDLDFVISDCLFVIDEEIYEAAGKEVTLSAADGTHPRIDVFYCDIDGTTGVLEGTPGADPSKPTVDTSSQVEISFALIPANATEPSDTSNVVVYDEDDDWTTAVSAATVNKADTANPYAGTKHVSFTNANRNDYISFTNSEVLSIGSFDLIFMYVWPISIGGLRNGRPIRQSGFNLEFYLGNDRVGVLNIRPGDYGLSDGSNSYQLLAIPTSDFAFSDFDSIRIVANANNETFYVDNVILQYGIPSSGAAYAYTNVNNPWSKAQASPIKVLVDAATVDVDLSAANVFEVTLGGNRTIDFTNAITGQHFTMFVIQDGTGSRTLTWDSAVDWAGGTAPTLSTGANAVDILSFVVDRSGNIHGSLGIADSQ